MPEPSARDHSAGLALANQWTKLVATGGPLEDVETAILAAAPDDAVAAVRTLSTSDIVPLLERLGVSDRKDLALAAAETLGSIRLDDAAHAADRVASTASDKAVQKAARRSVYRLSSQGFKVAHAAQESPARSGSREASLYRVVASAYDGAGNRAMWFGAERPLGDIYMVAVMLNDVRGLVDVTGRDTTKKRFSEQESQMRETDPMGWVELPFEYAKQLIQEGAERTTSEHLLMPQGYGPWAELIGNPAEPLQQALIYQDIRAIEVRLHPTLERETPALFEQPEIEPWFVAPSLALKWARELAQTTTSRLIVTPESDASRQDRILKEAIKDLFPPKVIQGLKRRLEETAYIFLRTGREQDARRAVAAAATIEDQRPLQPSHPFIRAMAARSLQIAYEIERSGVEPARLALAP